MKVLLTATSFLSSYGGPAFSVSNLAYALAEANVEVGLWAPDGSATLSKVIPQHGSIRCLNGSAEQALISFGRVDVIHDNGIWLSHNHNLANLARKYQIARIVSLRGMLEPWAFDHRKWKKRSAWFFYQKKDLKSAQYLHATAQSEAENLQRYRLGVPIRVIPNGVDIPDNKEAKRQSESMKALFMGRIHPKKGLPMLIQAWARIRPRGWHLLIAGPDEAGHLSEVKALVNSNGLNDAVCFLGPIESTKRKSIYDNSDLFILPTYSENFGLVVAEALAHALPVLTTKGAPWSMLQKHACGWWVDPTVDSITDGLRQSTACSSQKLQDMGLRGKELVSQKFSWRLISNKFIAIYKGLEK